MQAGRKPSWTDEQFLAAVRSSYSIAGTCRALGLVAVGGNYHTVHRALRRLTPDISHWTGAGWARGKTGPRPYRQRPLADILRVDTPFTSSKLRGRLLAAGLLAPECAACGLREWQGRPIPLELDHVNGEPDDNRLENLRLVCPNCHALTDTYRGRNIGRHRRARGAQSVA